MGDMVGSIAYGVLISQADHERLYKELFEERQTFWDGKPCWSEEYNPETKQSKRVPSMGWYEKNDKAPVCIDNPYETEDYLLVIRESQQSSFNGVKPIKIQTGKDWDTTLSGFLKLHGVEPQSEPSWLLIGCYN